MPRPPLAHLARLAIALLALAALALAPAAPAGAADGPDDSFGSRPFAALRGSITRGAPPAHQRPLLVKVDRAEAHALGTDRLPPNPCAAAGVLGALDHQVAALAGKQGFDPEAARAIRGEVRSALATLYPTDPHSPGDPYAPPARCLPPNPISPE